MRFRLKAFGLHLLASTAVLSLVLGTLYLGWYRWPGWYLTDVTTVIAVLIGVDLTLGPLFTLIVARSTKPRAILARDIGVIVAVQLCALVYGTTSLWKGRPLYYAFAMSAIELVQAYDINAQGLAVARERKRNAELLPHWYSLPRWIWAPLPEDQKEFEKMWLSIINGGDDATVMPQYFKRWEQGLPELRKQLQKVEDVAYFSKADKQLLKERMHSLGLDTNQVNAMPLSGRGGPVLVVFDPATLRILAMVAPPHVPHFELQHWMGQRYFKNLLAHQANSRH